MTTEPTKLRPVPASAEVESKEPPRSGRGRPSGSEIALALALVVALTVLIWSRIQLGDQIDVLRGETRALQAAVAERERVINAQTGRLEDVRTHVDRLGALLAEPIPGME